MSRSVLRPGGLIAAIGRLAIFVPVALILVAVGPLHRPARAVCGDGIVDAEEDCDVGGTCIGGPAAGSACHVGDATCSGGACKTFGGTGCAANCTSEHDVPYVLGPCAPEIGPVVGTFRGGANVVCTPEGPCPGDLGNSCVSIASDFLTIPLPFDATCTGGENAQQPCGRDADCPGGTCTPPQQTLTVGKERNGKIPVVVKAASVKFPAAPVSTLACGCVKGVAAKTCGGTVFEADGRTLSPNCAPGFSDGDSVCEGKAPCAFVHGEGNTAAGEVGCAGGLDNINLSFEQDSGGSSGPCAAPAECPPTVVLSGHGGPGSALFFQTLGITAALGGCTGADPSTYGPDGILCTDDDPSGGIIAAASTLALVTGTAMAVVHNANGSDGTDLGPVTASGVPFSCAALECGDLSSAAGGGLAAAYALAHLDTAGDMAVAVQFLAAGTPVTSCPTPTATPEVCAGDCDGDGAVTVDEVIILVNLALETPNASACPTSGCHFHLGVIITCVTAAVGNVLNGCA